MEAENKEADRSSSLSSVASSCSAEDAQTDNKESDQLSIDDSTLVEQLGLISQQGYAAQFFGFTPKSFSDGCELTIL